MEAYDGSWLLMERVQSVNYSPWHVSRWFIWKNYSAYSGRELKVINTSSGLNDNILNLIVFPQKNGSLEPLLKKPFINKYGSVDYYGAYGIYEKNGSLWVWLEPTSETATKQAIPPYTDCGFLTAKEKIAYATDRRHEPEVYHGEFDLKARKFVMRYVSAPIQFVYWAEWGGNDIAIFRR